jgi:mono/diheme cytochrome c family protein
MRMRGLALVCAMLRTPTHIVFSCFVLLLSRPARGQSPYANALPSSSAGAALHTLALRKTRQSPSDLEVGGELAGLPPGATRFLTREDLLALPQANFTARGDTNFAGSERIGGVRLGDLVKQFATEPASAMVVAICDDKYRANYPRAYMSAHNPVLVLTVDGKPPAGWPKDSQEHKYDMGPYMISQANFNPAFKILSESEEPQIPWGVLRLEFRDEKTVYDSIAPRGPRAGDAAVAAGYRIARQNCFRCHNAGGEGGQKSGISWKNLAVLAADAPRDFAEYVRNPASKNAQARMPGNPAYDDATLDALTGYFQTFRSKAKP